MPLEIPYRATSTRLVALALLTAVPLTGCGAPPELKQASPVRPTASAAPSASAGPTATPIIPAVPPAGPPPAGSATVAVACRNGPSGERVIRLVRGAAGILSGGTGVKVRSGPLCADDWQYTVLQVSGHEDLTVVTRGRPESLTLVTAGTDVCTIEVRTGAPTGIRTLACDSTVGVPGA